MPSLFGLPFPSRRRLRQTKGERSPLSLIAPAQAKLDGGWQLLRYRFARRGGLPGAAVISPIPIHPDWFDEKSGGAASAAAAKASVQAAPACRRAVMARWSRSVCGCRELRFEINLPLCWCL
jgi:hypothetical protein